MDRSRKIAAIAGGVVGAGVIAAAVAFATSGGDDAPSAPASFTASLTMNVSVDKYKDCGHGGYSDIREGAQVEIVDQKNNVLAVADLGQNLQGSTSVCNFTALIKDIPAGRKMYGAKVGNANRGVIWKTEAEARAGGWALTLGD